MHVIDFYSKRIFNEKRETESTNEAFFIAPLCKAATLLNNNTLKYMTKFMYCSSGRLINSYGNQGA